jgi:peptidoglycan-associated lipoprotein
MGLLIGCESTGSVNSSSSEEAAFVTITPPLVDEVEEEEVFEPVVEEPEVSLPLAESVEQEVEPKEDLPQETAEPQVPAALEPQQATSAEPARPKRLQDIYFAFDQATILNSAKPILEANSVLFNTRFKHLTLLVEGHCDERGSVEYNLVLGVRRAQVVKAYLVDLGIPQLRIRIVSYGKERPVCSQQHDACWQKNRRTHFVLQ